MLEAAPGSSWCEWKGAARYWSVRAGPVLRRRAAWSYAHPTEAFKPLASYLAFYAEDMDACFVGQERVLPQPGSYYGGWVTANLTGRIKGAPGTEHW